MSKYVLLMSMILFLVFAGTMVASINQQVTSDVTTADISDEEPGFFNLLASLWDFTKIFFAIILFRVEGMPFAFNIFIFWPISVGVIYMIVDIIRGSG